MTFIIAECCVNFRDIAEATHLITAAAAAGADACKFQCYQSKAVENHPRAEELQNIALGEGQLLYLKHACANHKVEFMCTPMYPGAIKLISKHVKRWKIRYADRNNETLYALLKHDARPFLVSCSENYDSIFIKRAQDKRNVVPMFCTPEYPPKEQVVPLRFREGEGFSSHYPDPHVPFLAALRGAEFIEVHVKLDEYDRGWVPIDDAVSLPIDDFTDLVAKIRGM